MDPEFRQVLSRISEGLSGFEERLDAMESKLRDVYGWSFDRGEEDEWSESRS